MADITLAERRHPAYDDRIALWDLYYQSAMGGDNFITEDNLFSHRLEDSEDYDERLERGYFLNFCDTIPTLYNSYIFKSRIERPADPKLDQFRKNVDGMGTNIGDFVKRAGYLASIFGVVHVIVDMPVDNKDKKTAADDRGLMPYAKILLPTRLTDWSLDANGQFQWVIMQNTRHNDLDPRKERETITTYKCLTKEEWWTEDDNGDKLGDFEDGTIAAGSNELGIVPVITMYHKESETPKIGESLLKDIVYVNRTILNWCSLIDEQIERQTFSQLTVPDQGELAEAAETGEDPLHKIGTSSIWTFNSESKHPPAFISPNVRNIQTVWDLAIDHIKEIYRMAGLIGSSDDMYVSRSGRAAQMGFLGVNSALAEKAYRYQEFENELSRLVMRYLNQTVSDDYEQVKYPTSFDVRALEDELDSYMSVMERNLSPRLNKEIQKNIARKAVPLAPEKLREEIENEIESGDGIVEPLEVQKAEAAAASFGEGEDGNPNSNVGKTFRTKSQTNKEEKGHNKKSKNDE